MTKKIGSDKRGRMFFWIAYVCWSVTPILAYVGVFLVGLFARFIPIGAASGKEALGFALLLGAYSPIVCSLVTLAWWLAQKRKTITRHFLALSALGLGVQMLVAIGSGAGFLLYIGVSPMRALSWTELYNSLWVIGIEILFTLVFLGCMKLFRLKRAWVPIIFSLTVVISSLYGLGRYRVYQNKQNQEQAYRDDYDAMSVRYRNDTKSKTMLGSLPRPLYVYAEGTDVRGITLDGRDVRLPVTLPYPLDELSDVYFDIYSDRVAYIHDQQLFVMGVSERIGVSVAEEINEALRQGCISNNSGKRRSLGIDMIYGDYVVLGCGGDVVNATTFRLSDGAVVSRANYGNGSVKGMIQFWMNGKGYRLIYNSHEQTAHMPVVKESGLYTRSWDEFGDTMVFFLEGIDEEYHDVTIDEARGFNESDGNDNEYHDLPHGWSNVLFRTGPLEYAETHEPFYSLMSSEEPKGEPYVSPRYFSIRGIYDVGMDRVVLEVNDGLLIIDLDNQKGHFTTDGSFIEVLMERAIPIGGGTRGSYVSCIHNSKTEEMRLGDGWDDYLFCLK